MPCLPAKTRDVGGRWGDFSDRSRGEDNLESGEPQRPKLISLGLNKIGLLGIRAPIISAFIVLLLTAAAAAGISRLKVDDSLSELFRTNTPEFRTYEEIDKRFPSSEYDVLVVVE